MAVSGITMTDFTNCLPSLYQILSIKNSISSTTKNLYANCLEDTGHNHSTKTQNNKLIALFKQYKTFNQRCILGKFTSLLKCLPSIMIGTCACGKFCLKPSCRHILHIEEAEEYILNPGTFICPKCK